MPFESLTHSDILRFFSAIDDHRVLEILSLKPALEDLEVTETYLAGMTDVMGEERIPLTGKAARIYEIVTRDELSPEDEYRS